MRPLRLSPPGDHIRRIFGTAGAAPNVAPSWNVAPTQRAMVIRRHPENGERRLDLPTWGLVPHFTKDLKACREPINARAETVATSGMFRSALASRRCLVPADAFYEWRAMADGKQPYAIARTDGVPMAFAGLWESWRAPDDSTLRTFTILTTTANGTMRQLHDRMPVVLEAADWPTWLGETGENYAALVRPAADDVLRLWAVSRAVNNVRNNGAELLDMADDPHAPPPNDCPAGAPVAFGAKPPPDPQRSGQALVGKLSPRCSISLTVRSRCDSGRSSSRSMAGSAVSGPRDWNDSSGASGTPRRSMSV